MTAAETLAEELTTATLRRVAILRALIDFKLNGSSYSTETVREIVRAGSWGQGMSDEFRGIIEKSEAVR